MLHEDDVRAIGSPDDAGCYWILLRVFARVVIWDVTSARIKSCFQGIGVAVLSCSFAYLLGRLAYHDRVQCAPPTSLLRKHRTTRHADLSLSLVRVKRLV